MTDQPAMNTSPPVSQAEQDSYILRNAGIIEVAVRNASVSEYMKDWEGRIEALQAENDKLRAERDAATGAFHMANEWIAELKAEVARLTAALAAEESRSGRLVAERAALVDLVKRARNNMPGRCNEWHDDADATLAAFTKNTDAQAC